MSDLCRRVGCDCEINCSQRKEEEMLWRRAILCRMWGARHQQGCEAGLVSASITPPRIRYSFTGTSALSSFWAYLRSKKSDSRFRIGNIVTLRIIGTSLHLSVLSSAFSAYWRLPEDGLGASLTVQNSEFPRLNSHIMENSIKRRTKSFSNRKYVTPGILPRPGRSSRPL
jgi:hypothetical protein